MTRDQFKQLEADLWRAADGLRANSELAASDYASPVLGLIFLRFADLKYARLAGAIEREFLEFQGTRAERSLADIALDRAGFYLPPHARYDFLLALPHSADIARAVKEAMQAIEEHKVELAGALPKDDYAKFKDGSVIRSLLKDFSTIPADAGGDVLGQIYEFFLGKFALAEGQGGGEFFTPRSVVRLMVEMIEPHGGTIFDPACGSGGMFVQSGHFIEAHRKAGDAPRDFAVYGQEKKAATVNLARMNLAVNDLRGDIKQGITYYDDHFGSVGHFDYVLANPPFNVDEVRLADVEGDARFNAFGVPRNKGKGGAVETVPNANYLWINLFATSLKPQGRAALVMANSASDARHSEADIRRKLIEAGLIAGMLSLPSNLFYTVTLPATLWFFDRAKGDERILFIDARNIFTPVDRAHREFSDAQIQNIAVIRHLAKGRRERFLGLVESYFADGTALLAGHLPLIESVSARLAGVLDEDADGQEAVAALLQAWHELPALQERADEYRARHFAASEADERNAAQRALRAHFEPFFRAVHADLKRLDKRVRDHEKRAHDRAKEDGKRPAFDRKTKELKAALEELHAQVHEAEAPFVHIKWLQDRFPNARYEDVTGLCKLATPADVEEQDYSLNPGRYVGVVIEEDGKTEEEWIAEVLALSDELDELNAQSQTLEALLSHNLKELVGE